MSRTRIPAWLIAAGVAALAAAGVYVWHKWQPLEQPPPPTAVEPVTSASPVYPLPPAQTAGEAPLPPLADSDPVVVDATSSLFADSGWRDLLNLDGIVRRWVVTIDALPRERLAQRTSIARRVPGALAVDGGAEALALSSDNFARYEPYVSLAENVDPKALVDAYRRLYPYFQQAYTELIKPRGYFNDRLIEVIDHLLAAPDAPQYVQLVQPRVMYQFADPQLESLSVGEKALVRMGPDNERRVKEVLRRVRAELVAASGGTGARGR